MIAIAKKVAGWLFYRYCFHIEVPSAATKWGENCIPLSFGIMLLTNMPLVHVLLSHLLHLCRLWINCSCSDLVEITFKLPETVANQMDQVCISLIPRQPQWVQQVHREVIKNQIQSLSFFCRVMCNLSHMLPIS